MGPGEQDLSMVINHFRPAYGCRNDTATENFSVEQAATGVESFQKGPQAIKG